MRYITRADLMHHPAFAGLDDDTCGNPIVWENSYECPDCGAHWFDAWSCGCDDECPNCAGTSVSPYRQDWLPAGKADTEDPAYALWLALPEAP